MDWLGAWYLQYGGGDLGENGFLELVVTLDLGEILGRGFMWLTRSLDLTLKVWVSTTEKTQSIAVNSSMRVTYGAVGSNYAEGKSIHVGFSTTYSLDGDGGVEISGTRTDFDKDEAFVGNGIFMLENICVALAQLTPLTLPGPSSDDSIDHQVKGGGAWTESLPFFPSLSVGPASFDFSFLGASMSHMFPTIGVTIIKRE